jgi:phosphoglycerol transferase MdoB-like AlkP superfamily enzyme
MTHQPKHFALNWINFFDHFQKNFKLMFVCIFSLTAFRAFLAFHFSGRFSDAVGLYDIFMAFAIGLRFDAVIAGYIALPLFLPAIFSGIRTADNFADLCRNFFAVSFLTISAAVFVANYLFINEFNDNFNYWVFGAVHDDFFAVVKSMWKEYPLIAYFSIAIISLSVLSYVSVKFLDRPFASKAFIQKKLRIPALKILATVTLLFVFVVFIRGSVGSRPVQLKDAGVTKDEFLNKLILNPYHAFEYAVHQHHKLTHAKGIEQYLPDGDIQSAAKLFFNTPDALPTLDDYMKKSAKGANGPRPRHIFLIVMESLDSWSLLERYRSFDLLPNIKKLGKEGILITSFLPASSGTMTSLAAIITGLPDAGAYTNFQPLAQTPFPTSLAPQFKRLGYKTNLFYGGYLSWQKIGDFCKAQGFDQIFGGGQMGAWQNREWGVGDDILFQFILNALNDSAPTFNLVLTTSYHSPYDLPVYREGFPYQTIPKDLETLYDKNVPLSVFGHLWYTDKLVGNFIRKIENKLPGCVFAVTGDHWSRKFLNQKPTLYEHSSVPLLLYGRDILKHIQAPEKIAGSHLDIVPTLIELAAPGGFEYYSMGKNLLAENFLPLSFGVKCIITPGFILDDKKNMEKLTIGNDTVPAASVERLLTLHRDYHGIGWWRIVNGPKLTGGK